MDGAYEGTLEYWMRIGENNRSDAPRVGFQCSMPKAPLAEGMKL